MQASDAGDTGLMVAKPPGGIKRASAPSFLGDYLQGHGGQAIQLLVAGPGLTKALGGTTGLQSKPGKGTRCTVTLPLRA